MLTKISKAKSSKSKSSKGNASSAILYILIHTVWLLYYSQFQNAKQIINVLKCYIFYVQYIRLLPNIS